MSEGQADIVLRFSRMGNGLQAAFWLALIPGIFWLVSAIAWHDGRGGLGAGNLWFPAFAALVLAWWATRAGWRLFSKQPAAVLADGRLVLHPSFGRWLQDLGPAEVMGAVVRQEAFLPRIDTLFLEVAGQERVGKLRSVTIAGGREALVAFQDAIEAWRTG